MLIENVYATALPSFQLSPLSTLVPRRAFTTDVADARFFCFTSFPASKPPFPTKSPLAEHGGVWYTVRKENAKLRFIGGEGRQNEKSFGRMGIFTELGRRFFARRRTVPGRAAAA